jgi:hydroxypyruvate isomerase
MAQLARLESHGYAGWVGLEYKSSGSSDDFGWMTRQGELA